jgi:glutamate dehydrogenase (NAD(P)+)
MLPVRLDDGRYVVVSGLPRPVFLGARTDEGGVRYEDQVTAENAPPLRCTLVAEGANGPTSVEADRILADRGIPVLPDILTNARGVTVSYFEWVQDLGRLFWDRDEIRRRLADKLADAFDRVWNVARGIALRDAALVAAIREVAAALEARGIYP